MRAFRTSGIGAGGNYKMNMHYMSYFHNHAQLSGVTITYKSYGREVSAGQIKLGDFWMNNGLSYPHQGTCIMEIAQ